MQNKLSVVSLCNIFFLNNTKCLQQFIKNLSKPSQMLFSHRHPKTLDVLTGRSIFCKVITCKSVQVHM